MPAYISTDVKPSSRFISSRHEFKETRGDLHFNSISTEGNLDSTFFLWSFNLKKKKKKGIYLPEMSTWRLTLLVSPPGSLGWKKPIPTQGLTRHPRKDLAPHFLLSCLSYGSGPSWVFQVRAPDGANWDVSYTPKDDEIPNQWQKAMEPADMGENKCPSSLPSQRPTREYSFWPVLAPPYEGHMLSYWLLALGAPRSPP